MLPKLNYPLIQLLQPSTKKMLNFRRYLVREEKILLMAKESKTFTDIFRAIKQVVNNSCQEPDFDVDNIPLFDLEYLYVQLRSQSVRNLEAFVVKDKEDNKEYKLVINFDEVKVDYREDINKTIKIDAQTAILIDYPMANIYDKEGLEARLKKDGIFELVLSMIKKVYVNNEPMVLTHEELTEFVDSLEIGSFKKIEEFMLNVPSLSYEVEYTNSLGSQRKITFSSLIDFFIYL